jgi:hypothetical protein
MCRDFDGKMEMVAGNESDKQDTVTRRTARRYRVSGIVAMVNSGEPAVMRIYDIARNGVSFLHTGDWRAADGKIELDIVVYDINSNSEYLINKVNGWVRSTDLIVDPERNGPIWRTRVTFQRLDVLQQDILHACLGQVSQSEMNMRGSYLGRSLEAAGSRYIAPKTTGEECVGKS